MWRRALSAARAQSERVMHAGRRRRAREQVEALAGARSVLFICEGNIYRSPFAAACFKTSLLAGHEVRVGSAGFVGPGRSTPPEAQTLARGLGVDLSSHRSQMLHGPMLAQWDVLVVMEARQARVLIDRFGIGAGRIIVLGDLDPGTIDERSIADPWQGSTEVLEGSYARVDRCVRELVEVVRSCWSTAVTPSRPESASFNS